MARAKMEGKPGQAGLKLPPIHTQDLCLEAGVVVELRGCPYWAALPTGEHEGWNGDRPGCNVAATSLGMCVGWVWHTV